MLTATSHEARFVGNAGCASFGWKRETAIVITQEAIKSGLRFEAIQVLSGVPLLVIVMQFEDVVPWRQDCKVECKLDLLANLPDDTLSCAPFFLWQAR